MSTTAHAAKVRVDRICNLLGASDAVRKRATEFAERAVVEHPINRSHSGIAAGAVYAAGLVQNEKETQEAVATRADVSTATIRETYQEIMVAEGYYDPEDFTGRSGDSHPGILARVRQFLGSDRAVSPVIGVILMVALTVVLAALVGTYAIGLQEDTAAPRPPADFTSDYDHANGSVTVTMTQGAVDADTHTLTAVGSASGEVCAFSGSVRAGNACSGQYTANETVRVVWTAADGSTSYTLHESEAPA